MANLLLKRKCKNTIIRPYKNDHQKNKRSHKVNNFPAFYTVQSFTLGHILYMLTQRHNCTINILKYNYLYKKRLSFILPWQKPYLYLV